MRPGWVPIKTHGDAGGRGRGRERGKEEEGKEEGGEEEESKEGGDRGKGERRRERENYLQRQPQSFRFLHPLHLASSYQEVESLGVMIT